MDGFGGFHYVSCRFIQLTVQSSFRFDILPFLKHFHKLFADTRRTHYYKLWKGLKYVRILIFFFYRFSENFRLFRVLILSVFFKILTFLYLDTHFFNASPTFKLILDKYFGLHVGDCRNYLTSIKIWRFNILSSSLCWFNRLLKKCAFLFSPNIVALRRFVTIPTRMFFSQLNYCQRPFVNNFSTIEWRMSNERRRKTDWTDNQNHPRIHGLSKLFSVAFWRPLRILFKINHLIIYLLLKPNRFVFLIHLHLFF